MGSYTRVLVLATAALVVGLWLAACSPTVKIQPPDEPIVINMNIKIEQEVRVKVEKDVEDLLQKNDKLF